MQLRWMPTSEWPLHLTCSWTSETIWDICFYKGFFGLAICGGAALAALASTPQIVSAKDFFRQVLLLLLVVSKDLPPRFSQQSVAGLRDCLKLCPLLRLFILQYPSMSIPRSASPWKSWKHHLLSPFEVQPQKVAAEVPWKSVTWSKVRAIQHDPTFCDFLWLSVTSGFPFGHRGCCEWADQFTWFISSSQLSAMAGPWRHAAKSHCSYVLKVLSWLLSVSIRRCVIYSKLETHSSIDCIKVWAWGNRIIASKFWYLYYSQHMSYIRQG